MLQSRHSRLYLKARDAYAGVDGDLVPETSVALSFSVVADRSWWFAGMTDKRVAFERGYRFERPLVYQDWGHLIGAGLVPALDGDHKGRPYT
jgi:hypothetical protein